MMCRWARAAVVAVALVTAGCGGTETIEEQSTPSVTEVPDIARWSSLHGVLVPIGESDGPSNREWEPFAGFSHTPQGAALAAIAQSVQLATASDNAWTDILAGVAAPGEGRDMYAANRALVSVSGLDQEAIPEIVGYTIASYNDSAATVNVVQRFSDESLASASTPVVWIEEDWRLELPVENAATITALDELPSDLINLEGTRQ